MSPDKQRIAIATACGWTHIKTWIDGDPSGWPPTEEERKESIDSGCDPCIPDYLADLNAMREPEDALCDILWPKYIEHLKDICKGHANTYRGVRAIVRATAAQRAEAFLKTLNLWTND